MEEKKTYARGLDNSGNIEGSLNAIFPRCPLVAPAAPPACRSSLPKRLAVRRGTEKRGLDMWLRMR